MYTECPNCATVFKITVQQLNAAAGQVRCGRCDNIFSALGNLKDSDEIIEAEANVASSYDPELYESVAPNKIEEEASTPSVVKDEGVADVDVAEELDQQQLLDEKIISELADLETAESPFEQAQSTLGSTVTDEAKSQDGTDADILDQAMLDQIADETEREPIDSTLSTSRQIVPHVSEFAVDQTDAQSTAHEIVPSGAGKKVNVPENYVLEELGGIQPKRKRSWSWLGRMLWSALILLLVLAFGLQLTYFNRTTLVKYQAVVPYLEKMCQIVRQFTECDVPDPIDLTELEVIDRDVRSHPKSKNALLITATILNTAEFAQPFPRLVMSFSGLNDELIAQRPFFPKEYLSEDVDIDKGMNTGVPVRIMLEIVDPGEEAVNFEFTFE